MKNRLLFGMFLITWMTASGLALGEESFRLEDRIVEYTLPNGMKFLLLRRTGTPVFSANIMFRVGGVDERPGITGLAHFYEHMAFKGTKTIGVKDYEQEQLLLAEIDKVAVQLTDEIAKGDRANQAKIAELQTKVKELETQGRKFVVKDELWDTYVRNGASGLNASTGKDMTQYYVSLPANRLELWAWLESDRLLNPVLREFYSERDVVCEEHRLGIETQPSGRLEQDFLATAFLAHPARYSVLGWMSDLQTVTRPQAQEFGRSHYVPANAAVALVGDLDIGDCTQTVTRYFGRLPAHPLPPPVTTQEPEQRGERRVVVEWDAQPQLLIGYHKPSPLHADGPVLDVIEGVLSEGRTSRLYKTLVQDRRLAAAVGAFSMPTDRYPNLFTVWAMPLHPHTTREVEQGVYKVLETLITQPPSEEELQKIRNNVRARLVRALESNRGLARELSYYQTVYGDWRYALKRVEMIERVTADDVRRVAQKYFVPTNRTIGEIVKTVTPQKKGK